MPVLLSRRLLLQSSAAFATLATLGFRAQAQGTGGRLIVAADSEPKNLNPAIVASNGVFFIASKVIEPLAVDGPMVSIRKFRQDPLKPADLLTLGTFDEEIYRLLHEAVKNRCNILVSGGTSSGKTSLLNALAFFISDTERVVTVEDTAELSLNHPHVVRLESRQGGFDGSGAVSIRELIRNSLRMRPDRVVVGEVRGAEVMDMLQAMNTGHEGSMATIHANSPRECLYRIEMLAGFAGFQGSEDSLRRQIASALDFIVQIGRLSNGKRRVLSVTEVTGMGDNVISTQELYRHETFATPEGEEKDRWNWLGIHPHTPKLAKMRNEQRPADNAPPESDGGGFWSRRR